MINQTENKFIAKPLLLAISTFVVCYILQVNLAVCLFLLCLVTYFKSQASLKKYSLLNITFLFIIIFVASYFILKNRWPVYYIPFCAIPMLAMLLFNQLELALIITLACAVAIASITGNNLYFGVLFFIGGISSSLLIRGGRRRIAIIRAGLIAGILQAITLLFIDQFRFGINNISIILYTRYPFFALNGVISSFIVLGVLPVFEYLFKRMTDISLLELADFHQPLLQRMVLEAPGTYHHSLVVGNLSEAACDAVGANALLARVGAYYHDIGKLQKPDYFSENQVIKDNKHDVLSPTMSRLIIMNHIKEGLELANKYRLNPRIIDFIQQHHGNSLVYYFYRRALEDSEGSVEVEEDGFRYPGPKPNTRETAVVLLADSVEAATRALKEPAPKKIEELVHKIINNKFIDGQLDECELTLKDLEKISAVFIRILSGIYHSRVTYPEVMVRQDRAS